MLEVSFVILPPFCHTPRKGKGIGLIPFGLLPFPSGMPKSGPRMMAAAGHTSDRALSETSSVMSRPASVEPVCWQHSFRTNPSPSQRSSGVSGSSTSVGNQARDPSSNRVTTRRHQPGENATPDTPTNGPSPASLDKTTPRLWPEGDRADPTATRISGQFSPVPPWNRLDSVVTELSRPPFSLYPRVKLRQPAPGYSIQPYPSRSIRGKRFRVPERHGHQWYLVVVSEGRGYISIIRSLSRESSLDFDMECK